MDQQFRNDPTFRTAASRDDVGARRALAMDRAPSATRRPAKPASRDAGPQPASSEMTALDTARTAFIEAARRDTPGTDLPRYVAILDALLKWTSAHTDRLAFRPPAKRPEVIRFERAGTKKAFWSVQTTRGGAPRLEVHLAPARASSAGHADVLRTLNAHSRDVLEEGDRLRIGFGALKNAAALAAVLALLDRLLEDTSPAVDTPA